MFHALSLRTRMMLLFCIVVGIVLAGSYAIFYTLVAREVHAQLDRQALETESPVVADLAIDPTEKDVNQLNLPGNYFELLDTSGEVLEQSRNLASKAAQPERPPAGHAADLSLGPRFPLWKTTPCAGAFKRGGELQVLALAVPTRAPDNTLRSFRTIIFLVLPLSLLLTALISAWYVGRSLRPVSRLTEHAARRAERVSHSAANAPGGIWNALPVSIPGDELDRLADTFNRLSLMLKHPSGNFGSSSPTHPTNCARRSRCWKAKPNWCSHESASRRSTGMPSW